MTGIEKAAFSIAAGSRCGPRPANLNHCHREFRMKKAFIGFSIGAMVLLLVAQAGVLNTDRAGAATAKPARPGEIYIADFVNDTLQTPSNRPHLLNRPRMMQEDPRIKEAKMIAAMSNALTEDLKSKSIAARRLFPGQPHPRAGWLVEGRFINADEGNRVARSVVGFGAGSTNMQVEVSVIDLASGNREPFAVFGATSKTGKMPGAVISKNPYVLAAKFVMSKRAPDRDVKKTARKIADVLVKLVADSPPR
jgi:hypothetical protein